MQTLTTATTASSAMDVQLPLDPATDNAEHVATLLRRVLGLVDEFSARQQATASDVVQALSVATALRSAMAEFDEGTQQVLGAARLVDIVVDQAPSTV
jgi:hypothetical protein